jgi:HK97 gp10 family phage protein
MDDDLERALVDMQASVERELPPAMLHVAEMVADEARSNHPYQDRSGDLTAMTVPGSVTMHGDTVTAQTVGETEYGGFVDEGTTHMAARPFLKPAFDRCEQRAAAEVSDRLARAAS